MQMKYLAVIGDPIAHSLSPTMHNAVLRRLEPDYTYIPVQVPKGQLQQTLDQFAAQGVRGFNVTIPHKVDILQHLDCVSPEAQLIGAVNTVALEAGRWVGYNTDGIGFLQSLEEEAGIDPAGRTVLILGAGGAARALAIQLGLAGVAEIIMANRTGEKAQALLAEMRAKISQPTYHAISLHAEEIRMALAQADLVINATPVGMRGYSGGDNLIRAEWLKAEHVVIDLVYRPLRTEFLQLAESVGCRTVSGLGMLLYQGACAYKIWFGVEPPIEVMREALLLALGE